MRFRLGFGYGFHHGPRVFALLVLVLVIAALVVGVMALVRTRRYPGPRLQAWNWPPLGPRIDPALNELRIRYTRRGELSWEEYARKGCEPGFPCPSPCRPVLRPEPAAAGSVRDPAQTRARNGGRRLRGRTVAVSPSRPDA